MTDPLVAASREAIARGSKSFALASRLFAPRERDRATLLYAWCRHADDVIDGQVDGFGRVEVSAPPAERLAELDARTRAALAGDGGGDLPFAALARVAAETSMPARYPLDLIEGFRSDVEERRFATFDDTLTYCYHVAGCVGVMMAIVMGVDPDDRATLDRACDLGLAFQLDNIARDVIEDAANGRCYLPDDWLAEAGLIARDFRCSRQPHRARHRRRPAGRCRRSLCRVVAVRHPGAAVAGGMGGAGGSGHLWRHRAAGACRGGGSARPAGDDVVGGETGGGRAGTARGARPASALA